MYRWVDHTGELELQLGAESERGVLEEALTAFGELLAERTPADGEPVTHQVVASAPDRSTLLAEWLSELAYLAESQGFIPERLDALELGDEEIEATVSGRRGSPPHLVKAVTYHRLGMWQEEDAWRARVIFDV